MTRLVDREEKAWLAVDSDGLRFAGPPGVCSYPFFKCEITWIRDVAGRQYRHASRITKAEGPLLYGWVPVRLKQVEKFLSERQSRWVREGEATLIIHVYFPSIGQ